MSKPEATIWDKMQAIDRRILYGILILLTASSLFVHVEIPVNPDASSLDLYVSLMSIPENKVVLLESDWTNSTRGESAGHQEALLRILMDRNIKFVVYSLADPQSPQVARDTMLRINEERKKQGLPQYSLWNDYMDLGYFPNAEGQLNSMANDLRGAWSGHKERDPEGVERDVFESPVLKNVKSVGDCSLLVINSASSTIDTAVERLYGKIPLGFMVTGVMGPSALPYLQAGQLVGMAIGLKGVYDVEYMMKYGVNYKGKDGKIKVHYDKKAGVEIPPIAEGTTFDRGARYFLPLHVALTLMIVAIALGNIAMFIGRKKEAK
ncbi:MAG TPA: hypothetical protein VNI20_14010 [Fimbriimonadaceae bacterium]|nr:hypothetical protein [Fimbriimonadaceae bacterium]